MEFLSSTKCDEAFDEAEKGETSMVHIWLRQRTGRKYITEISGLAIDLNLNKIAKYMRHEFHCSAVKTRSKTNELIIRLQGDQRELVFSFLIVEKIISKEYLKVHGF